MNTPPTFADLGLSASVLEALSRKGFEEPTPIQALVIPELLAAECDLIGQAQTGTGKTAAFALPLIEKLIPGAGGVQALVLAPTRELAVQICEEISSLKGTKPFSVAKTTSRARRLASIQRRAERSSQACSTDSSNIR